MTTPDKLLRRASAALLAAAAVTAGAATADTGETRRPNIVFIIADDQAPFDFRTYDPKSVLETPNIDRLAREGVTLDAAHHMGAFLGAVCTPSRHMVMCGRTLWHLPIGPWADRHCPPGVEQNSLGAVFNRAGFDTMRTSKKGNSFAAANKLFTVRKEASKRGGDDGSGSAWHADQVIEFLRGREATGDDDPFLVYLGFSHPHDTRDGQPELLEKYGAVNHADPASPPPANPDHPPLPVNYLPAQPFPHGHPTRRHEVAVSGVWERRDEHTIRNEIGRQFACAENIDIQVGRVLEQLESTGELDNTYVIYTSDHGMAIGRHGLQGKQNLYEHTWRVPFVARGPGIPPGTRAPGNVYLLDVLATLCDLAGIEVPPASEGTTFRPVLEGERPTVRDVLFGAYAGGTKPGIRCVKSAGWKLIQYDVLDGQVRESQLFDLTANPHEFLPEHGAAGPLETNLAGSPEHAGKLAEMEALLLAEMRRLDDPWRLWNQPGDDLHLPPGPLRFRQRPR